MDIVVSWTCDFQFLQEHKLVGIHRKFSTCWMEIYNIIMCVDVVGSVYIYEKFKYEWRSSGLMLINYVSYYVEEWLQPRSTHIKKNWFRFMFATLTQCIWKRYRIFFVFRRLCAYFSFSLLLLFVCSEIVKERERHSTESSDLRWNVVLCGHAQHELKEIDKPIKVFDAFIAHEIKDKTIDSNKYIIYINISNKNAQPMIFD